jgi:hypothetical protein
MPDKIIITNPPPILVQVKGGKPTSVTTSASAGAGDDQYARHVAAGAFDQANAAYDTANAAFAEANTAIYTAAQIRANISNTAPINYSPTTGVISHADSGVAPTTYGNTTFVPTITVDAKGHVTSITNTAIALPPSFDQFARDQANAAFNQANTANVTGQAAFDKANTDFTLATTANTVAASAYNQANIATTNADAAFARANAAYANANTAIYTAGQIRANLSNTAPINYDSTTGTISHADSSVVATTYGNTTFVPTITVDAKGHVTSIVNTAIALPPSFDQFARDQANAAYDRANTANTVAASSYNQANIATTNADAAFAKANSANVTAQAAFDKANTDGIVAASAYAQANIATTNADAAFAKANAAYANANTAIYTAEQIRSNISNTAPINYDSSTGVISHATSGVTPSGYGDASHIPVFVVDANGHVTSVSNVAVQTGAGATDQFARDIANAAFNQANTANVTGQAAFDKANGAIYTAAQIRSNISNTAPINYDPSTGIISHALSGVTATTYGNTNFVPSISVDSNGHVTAVTNVAIDRTLAQGAFDRANAAYANANTAIYTAGQIRANISNTTPILYDPASGVISLTTVPVSKGGTGQTAITVNGSLLIGNTVSGGFDVNTLTQGTGIAITNDKGSIVIAATGGSSTDQYARDKANGAAQNSFVTINVAGQSDIVADSNNDTLVLVGGNGISIITDAPNDTITIAVTSPALSNGDWDFVSSLQAFSSGLFVISVPHGLGGIPTSYDADLIAVADTGEGLFGWSIGDVIQAKGNFHSSTYALNYMAVDAANVYFFISAAGGNLIVPTKSSGNPNVLGTLTNWNIRLKANWRPVGINGFSSIDPYARNKANGAAQNTFLTVNVAGQNNVVADSNTDTLVLVAGTGMVITTDDANDTITFTATGGASSDQFARDQANAAFDKANGAIYTAAQIRANISNTAPINYDPSTGVISHALSGATASGYGDAATVAKVVVDSNGHVTSVTNTAIAISASQITSGTLGVNRGGTGQTAITVNGSLLIGNTVSGGFDVNPLTQGTGILITNDKGSITIAATGGSALDQFARDQANAAFDKANSSNNLAQGAFDKANGSAQLSFVTINVAGQNNVIADSNADTLILVAGTYTSIITDAPNDTITIASTGDQFARDTANSATTTGQAAFDKANGAIYTAAQIRANISNTAPINYEPTTGVISHALSGAVASGYGDAATVAKVVVDDKGHVTSVTNTSIAISAAAITSGTLAVGRGGTGQTAITVNGSLLIGNTVSGGFDVNAITPGTNITITNDKGSITIASSDAFAQAQANAAFAKANIATTNADAAFARANAAYANGNTAIYTAAQIRANISNTAPINYDSSTGVISHATSGVTASGYGDAATVPKVVVDDKGHVTSVTNTSIAIAASQITSGTLAVGRGGTGQTAASLVNGAVLIGNTVSGGYDLNTLTQGTGIAITNDKGSITIATTGGASTDQYARDKANGAAQNAFVTISVAGQSDVVADSNTDTLTIVAANGMTITTNASTDTVTFEAGAKGTGTDRVFYENDQNVTANYAIATGRSAMSTGPITINTNVIVTVPSGSRWVIL